MGSDSSRWKDASNANGMHAVAKISTTKLMMSLLAISLGTVIECKL